MPTLAIGELFALLCALFWAVAVLLFRKGGEQVPPVALNVYKGAVAILLFALTLPLFGQPFLPPRQAATDYVVLLVSGAIGIGVADSIFFASLNRLGATGSAVVDCVYGPFVVLLAWSWLGDPLPLTVLGALALMVAAILVGLYEPRAAGAAADRAALRAGIALGVLSMFLTAAGIVLAKPVLGHCDVLWATLVRLIGGQLVLVTHLVRARHRASVRRAFTPGPLWKVLLPSALLGSYLAMIFWIAGMKYTRVSVAGILNQTATLFVPLLAALFLRERLTLRKGIAVVMGFAGAVLATR